MTQPDAARVERGPITEVKRFALGMADLLERQGFTIAAAELRRLHAECEHHKAWVAHITAENKSLEAQRDALLEALKNTVPALIRLGDFVGNTDDGGASGMGRIDRCDLLLQVHNAITATERTT